GLVRVLGRPPPTARARRPQPRRLGSARIAGKGPTRPTGPSPVWATGSRLHAGQGGWAMADGDRGQGTTVHRAPLATARESPTEHVPRMVHSREVSARMHGSGAAGRFNNRLAVVITRAVGTMWAAYLFVLIALVSLPQAFAAFTHGDTVTGITWL